MATGTFTSSTTISTFTGYCFFAQARAGSNGAVGGVNECLLGQATSIVGTRKTWDGNVADGLDSNWVNVELMALPGGGSNGLSWSVAGATLDPLTYSRVAYGAIDHVVIQSAVRMPGRAAWRNLVVDFYNNGFLIDSYPARSGPSVDKMTLSPPVTAEQVLTVYPAAGTYTQVVVSGQIRLSCPSGSTPAADDLFTSIYVYAANCQAV